MRTMPSPSHLHLRLQAESYDVYTRVSMFVDWIEQKILESGGMDACGYILENSFTDENDPGFQDGENSQYSN